MTATLTTERTTTLYETDWLGSQPVFYNERTARASHNIHDVIDLDDLQFHPEGFNNYLRFGYSVFGQTPIRHVKVLPASSRLTLDASGRFHVCALPDPVERWLGRTSDEHQVIEALTAAVREWEHNVDGVIIVPTSGGYDSRLLNVLLRDKRRIRSFTYGLAARQAESSEVVYARRLAERLGTRWEQVPLGDFHRYFDDWDALFGPATHAHGMYQIEFYRRIAAVHSGPHALLSGIIGDAWAGDVEIEPLERPADLTRLGYAHGMHADARMSLLRDDGTLAGAYFEQHRDRLRAARFRVVEAMRFKIILLNYLLRVPATLGFRPWSPFLVPELALAMLTLPDERRAERRWQRDFFARHRLDFESTDLSADRRNTLNQQALKRRPLRPLDTQLLSALVRPDYVQWINDTARDHGALADLWWCLVRQRRWGRPLRRRGFVDRQMEAYCAYLTLRPIDNLLRRQAQARCDDRWNSSGAGAPA